MRLAVKKLILLISLIPFIILYQNCTELSPINVDLPEYNSNNPDEEEHTSELSLQFGSDPDQNRKILIDALNTGENLVMPEGEHIIQVYKGVNFVFHENIKIRGLGMKKTRLRFQSDDKRYKSIFTISKNNIEITSLGMSLDSVEDDSTQFFTVSGSSVLIKSIEINGNNTLENPNLVNAFQFGNADTENISILNSDIHNVQRVILRPNQATGKINNVRISNNFIHELGQGGVQFNTPLEPAKDIHIINNRFDSFHAGTEQIFIGFASGKSVLIEGNQFFGAAKNCIHLEEDSDNIIIRGNECRAASHAVYINHNNVVGVSEHPDNILIEDNKFINSSSDRVWDGIQASHTGANFTAFSGLVIRRNIFDGYRHAVNLDNDIYTLENNTFRNSTQCIRLRAKRRSSISLNASENCDTYEFSITDDEPIQRR